MDEVFSRSLSLYHSPLFSLSISTYSTQDSGYSGVGRPSMGSSQPFVPEEGGRWGPGRWIVPGRRKDRRLTGPAGGSPGEDPTRLLAVVPCTVFAQGSSSSQCLDFFLFLKKSQHLLCLLSRREICLHLPRQCLRSRGDVLECVFCCTGCTYMGFKRGSP